MIRSHCFVFHWLLLFRAITVGWTKFSSPFWFGLVLEFPILIGFSSPCRKGMWQPVSDGGTWSILGAHKCEYWHATTKTRELEHFRTGNPAYIIYIIFIYHIYIYIHYTYILIYIYTAFSQVTGEWMGARVLGSLPENCRSIPEGMDD